MANFDDFSDQDWVDHLIKNDHEAIVAFFYKKYLKLFAYNLHKIYTHKVDVLDHVHEFYLHLEADNWKQLKSYQSNYSLTPWISVVSYRFFKKNKESMIDSGEFLTISDKWETETEVWTSQSDVGLKKDIMNAIEQIKNERDREIAGMIFMEDRNVAEIARQFGLTVDYLYTVKNRIIKALRTFLTDYDHE